MSTSLPKQLQPALKALEKDLLARAKLGSVEAGLRATWTSEQRSGQTGQGFDVWRRERVTQFAVAWVLSVVFVRTLEDRGLIDPRVAGPTPDALHAAEDREATFTQLAPFLGAREYLLTVFRELSRLPGARDVFDAHNPVWGLAPSSQGAAALLEFFRKGEHRRVQLTFGGNDSRFLGDLYQDLSTDVRKRYALLQTPDFIEAFILEQTLDPAISEFGLAEVRLIDPTCGSGHFLLGAFRRLFARWQEQAPDEAPEVLARRALMQVAGVDVNPYAVAIARFRLVLEFLDAVGIERLEEAPELSPQVIVADSLLHRFDGEQTELSDQLSMSQVGALGEGLYRLENLAEVEGVLKRRYHAVVGNPPYIAEQDSRKRKKFIQMYGSASGQYSLSAPFTERFFELAHRDGYVGLINSNAFTKRDFGKALIEQVLPTWELTKIIDTSGCYIPGHGTPTLLLFGRNRKSDGEAVLAVLGKRGEQQEPERAAQAPVWLEIAAHHDEAGFEGDFISVDQIENEDIATHPWVLVGGGARQLLSLLQNGCTETLGQIADDLGFSVIIGEDDAFVRPPRMLSNVPACELVLGDQIRDWSRAPGDLIIRPFTWSNLEVEHDERVLMALWPWKRVLEARIVSGSTSMKAAGRLWFDLRRLSRRKHATPLSITFGFVATHNHFVLDRGGKVFNRSAPIIKLRPQHTIADHQALLGYLNSSTMAFWGRLVFFPKGGDQMGDGARLSKTPWQDRLEYAGNLLGQLPVPELPQLHQELLPLVEAIEETVRGMEGLAPEKVLPAALAESPSIQHLRHRRDEALAERARLRGILVSLQEELDWRVYGLFGFPTVTAPSVDTVRVPMSPEHRPFEVRLARELDSDISASEWFRVHRRSPASDVDGPLTSLYRQRLELLDAPEQGRALRLLETAETKRRWPAQDDGKAFLDAARDWLLDRIEGVFRDQSQPELLSTQQLTAALAQDAAVQAVIDLLGAASGADLHRMVTSLTDEEGVPYLAALRYTETGREKRRLWEEVWELQRAEDAGTLEVALAERNLTAIPVPDKYATDDFQRGYWKHRGALDVPKERFVTVPNAIVPEEATPLIGWAGWDALQSAQALSGLYQRRKIDDGWTGAQLLPLLAGLEERLPWLLQWHDAPSEAYGGTRLGGFFRDFIEAEVRELGHTRADLREWAPAPVSRATEPRPRRARAPAISAEQVLAALRSWPGEEDARPDDLVEQVGGSKAGITKHLKALVESGDAEQTRGRPARFRATSAP